MLSNLPSRINYRTSSDIRQDLRNWIATNQPSCNLEDLQPISKPSTAPNRSVGKPLQPISEQPTALEVLATTQRSINRLREQSATNQRRINRPCLNLKNIAV
jgi:hypothetical protein